MGNGPAVFGLEVRPWNVGETGGGLLLFIMGLQRIGDVLCARHNIGDEKPASTRQRRRECISPAEAERDHEKT